MYTSSLNFKKINNESEGCINNEDIKYMTQKTPRNEMDDNINDFCQKLDGEGNLCGYESDRKNKNINHFFGKYEEEKINKADENKFITSSKTERYLKINPFIKKNCLTKRERSFLNQFINKSN